MIYFVRICNTGVLLVRNGKISCDVIRVCSDDSQEYAEFDTLMIYSTFVTTLPNVENIYNKHTIQTYVTSCGSLQTKTINTTLIQLMSIVG